VLWAALLALTFPYVTHMVGSAAEPTRYTRSMTDLRAAYFFLPTLLVQTLAMPVFYQSVLTCFDELRHFMKGGADLLRARRLAPSVSGPGSFLPCPTWRLTGPAW